MTVDLDTVTPITLKHVSGKEAAVRYGLPERRNLFKTTTPVLNGSDATECMETIRRYFHDTYELYEKVFECLAGVEAFTITPVHKLRHPLIFYYTHTATFYINKLVIARLTTRINPFFEHIFAVGVDEMSWDDTNESHYDWPSVHEVNEYRLLVRDRVDQLLRSGKHPLSLPLTYESSIVNSNNAFWWAVVMGMEHERIHLESASVHVRELPLRLVRGEMSWFWNRCMEQSNTAPMNSLVEVGGGTVVLGRQFDSPVYGWDLDYSRGVTVDVASFKASRMLVSNAEFLSFMKADGYTTRQYWDAEGWAWVTWKKPEHPWFWVKSDTGSGYLLRLQVEQIPLPLDWPVEVNNLEAQAFCRFKGEEDGKPRRLLTEGEWLLMYDRYIGKDVYQWDSAPGNINLEHHRSSCPVNKYAHGPFFDVVGNVWQHTEISVYPYRGFKVHPYYDDFSAPTFDGQHSCMKGGTWISTGNEATRDARFAFRRHFFQYIGIRYVEGSPDEVERTPAKETIAMDAVAHFAYAKQLNGVPNVNLSIANHAKEAFKRHARVAPRRAMDIICGAGRVTYELTTDFAEVVGCDFTATHLAAAFAMKEHGTMTYVTTEEGHNDLIPHSVNSCDFPWGETYSRACFFQADSSNLHSHLANFDLIVAFNLLESSHSPELIPGHLLQRLNSGGVLIIASTFEWQPICQPERGLPLFAEHADHTALLVSMLPGASLVEEPFGVRAVYPTSTASGKEGTVCVLTFLKH